MADSSYDENKDGASQVLKTDVLGRVKTGAQQREAMLDEFERSGLSGTIFATVCIQVVLKRLTSIKNPFRSRDLIHTASTIDIRTPHSKKRVPLNAETSKVQANRSSLSSLIQAHMDIQQSMESFGPFR